MSNKEPCGLKASRDETHIEWKIYFPSNFEVLKSTYVAGCVSNIFSFSRSSWRLQMLPPCRLCPDDVYGLQLLGAEDSKPYEYKFGLKRLDGSVEPLASGVLEEYELYSERHNVIKISELLQRKNELTLDSTLTIVCILKRGTALTFKTSNERNSTKVEMLDILSEKYKNLFTDEDSCDTILQVKDKQYKAHRNILIAWSSVFADMFKQTETINILDCNSDTFPDFLKFLYTAKLSIKSYSQAIDLYQTSVKYDVQELKESCVEFLMQNLSTGNVCDIAQFAKKYKEEELLSVVQDYFNRNLCKIFKSSEWQQFMVNDCLFANELLKNMSCKVKVLD